MGIKKQDLDSEQALLKDRQIIRTKFILKQLYLDFYNQIKKTTIVDGKIVEIGSGAGFIKEVIPGIITSDVIKGPDIDKVFFAEKMPFKNSSIAAFLMIDVLHHIKNPIKAFKEMQRCLKNGGKIIMIEPYNSPVAGLMYKYVHYEHFDPKAGWEVRGEGRMSDSNTAMPWIIFVRDRVKFEKKFPKLKIIKVYPHTPFRYLFSGGLSKWQLLPNFLYPTLKLTEKLLTPLNPLLGMFVTIELEKNED